jgi:hypothetical protein
MDTFKVDVECLGQWSLDNLSGVREVHVIAHETDRTAHLEFFLEEDTWPARERVIEQMVEIQEMFFEEFSISYNFGQVTDGDLARAEGADTRTFVAA